MSNKKCVREKYLYLSAMLRAREAKMLTRDKAERMIDAPSFDEAAKMLTDCGYKDMSGFSAKQVEQTLAEHRAGIFAELARMSPDAEPVEIFRMRYDYHNAKIVIKTEAEGHDRSDLMSESGRVSPEVLKRSFAEEKTLVIVDPVLGDREALYDGFTDAHVDAMRELCSLADLITPNRTEAALLAGLPASAGDRTLLQALQTENTVITSIQRENTIGFLARLAWRQDQEEIGRAHV